MNEGPTEPLAASPARGAPDGPRGRDVAWIAAGVALGYGLAAVLFFLGLKVFHGKFPGPWRESTAFAATAYLVQTVILTLPVALIGVGWRRIPWSAFGLRPTGGRWFWIAGAGCLVLIVLAESLDRLLDSPLSEKLTGALAPEGFSWNGFVTMILVAGLIAPFGEELLFRGVLYRWLRQRWGVPVGVIASALLFGAVHLDPYWAAQAATFGVFFAILYEKSGSIWPAYLGHALINMTGVAMLYATL